ncbi:MAG: hypothetical protein EHM14_09240 [Methanothrix sp.]|nr:MAG: hypothetical protein EHM14_09240 [Methanothrix sp.]
MITVIFITLSAAVEPQYLGRGRINQAINLETGAKVSAIAHYFGTGGFVAPQVPITRELSSSAMAYQSEKLRDESMISLKSVQSLFNQTRELAANVEILENRSEEGALESKLNALDAKKSAALSRSEVERARSINNETDAVARKTKIWAKQQVYATWFAANSPVRDASTRDLSTNDNIDDLASLRCLVMTLSDTIERLDERISRLENKTER